MGNHHKILIIGGGTGGITVAARLLRKDKSLDIGIIEPSSKHYYQPAWTLVGAGTYNLKDTERNEKDFIPKGATWIKDKVVSLDPDNNSVTTSEKGKLTYDYLVVAAGIQYNWEAIPGLKEALGKRGVTSNYEKDMTTYTWELLQKTKSGNAIFTQPATPIKCGGAPQKIMYLAEDYWRKNGVRDNINVIFATPGTVIFGVKKFAETLTKIVTKRNIFTRYYHKLVAIDPEKMEAVYQYTNPDKKAVLTDEDKKLGIRLEGEDKFVIPFTMLHTPPPQSAPDFIKNSKLARPEDPYGWVDVDKYTLQHVRYPNVYSLGDAAGTPNAKTGAAVRKQAPVLVENLMDTMKKQSLEGNPTYNGYGSCPLVTRYGRMVLAEFDYENKPTPSFPINTAKERYSMWILKKYFLPWLYWNRMLKGKA
ncbi:MAG: FAD/NAD(P)-binding oxidoreductase [Cyclobacteriaceae bacterium]